MNFQRLTSLPNRLMVVWAYGSLIHIPSEEAKAVIRTLHSVLVPNGAFAIGVIEGQGASMLEHEIMPGAQRYVQRYTSEELLKMIEPYGFTLLTESRYESEGETFLAHLYQA